MDETASGVQLPAMLLLVVHVLNELVAVSSSADFGLMADSTGDLVKGLDLPRNSLRNPGLVNEILGLQCKFVDTIPPIWINRMSIGKVDNDVESVRHFSIVS